ncbi:MAG: SDR family NAD(P)-dependent oxidoreductase [Brevundimonas sp.]|nr:MAG: SDR family NAD(P)-dependent oxidoreductase [Brevundimonas sp.]
MNITGNTILITGGGTGIGRALAETLHARGNQVIITGRREGPLAETVAANPGMAFAVLDVADPAAIRAFATQVVKDHPALNVVINNAGVMVAEDLKAEPFDLDVVESTVTTNLLGPIRLTAALLPHLRAKTAATVMTVSSGLAFIPLAATPTYSATKAAIHSWSQALRHQLADTAIEVLELAPPAVATDLMPGHAENPNSMPLADYTAEVIGLIERGETPHGEILVERVKPLRFAESRGNYETVWGMLNGAH